jgi:hypothetical protein
LVFKSVKGWGTLQKLFFLTLAAGIRGVFFTFPRGDAVSFAKQKIKTLSIKLSIR